MTKDEARIVLLENALQQAQSTVGFLHACLTQPGYSYSYPHQTLRNLQEWAYLVPEPLLCVHSFHKDDCESCQQRLEKFIRLDEAKKVLGCE